MITNAAYQLQHAVTCDRHAFRPGGKRASSGADWTRRHVMRTRRIRATDHSERRQTVGACHPPPTYRAHLAIGSKMTAATFSSDGLQKGLATLQPHQPNRGGNVNNPNPTLNGRWRPARRSHLNHWYLTDTGKAACGSQTVPGDNEKAMVYHVNCDKCTVMLMQYVVEE